MKTITYEKFSEETTLQKAITAIAVVMGKMYVTPDPMLDGKLLRCVYDIITEPSEKIIFGVQIKRGELVLDNDSLIQHHDRWYTPTSCPKCHHGWEYKGDAKFITCPKCRSIFKNVEWKGKVNPEDGLPRKGIGMSNAIMEMEGAAIKHGNDSEAHVSLLVDTPKPTGKDTKPKATQLLKRKKEGWERIGTDRKGGEGMGSKGGGEVK